MYQQLLGHCNSLVMPELNLVAETLAMTGEARRSVVSVYRWTAWGPGKRLAARVFVAPVSPLHLQGREWLSVHTLHTKLHYNKAQN